MSANNLILPLFEENEVYENILVKSPMNYVGGKYKTLPQILPLFPEKIATFIDLFAGGCNVGININAENIIFNDNISYLIDLYNSLQYQNLETIINFINNRISEYDLSLTNQDGYNAIRDFYNSNRNPLDLFVLIAFAFNHQIRFNNNHGFNTPFGKNRSCYNSTIHNNLIHFIKRIQTKNIKFNCSDFINFDYDSINGNDFIYCDPPYLITTASYNDGKRGFKGWGTKEEYQLLDILKQLSQRGIRFALSNVVFHKGKKNEILERWIKENGFNIHYISNHYANSSYHTLDRDINSTQEVLITNY